jgi:RimJ/RimL family protein N-acetyltransferase
MIAHVIEGDRVKLRPIRRDDLPLMRRWASDPTLMRFWANPCPMVSERHFEEDLEGRFATFDTSGYFIIEDPDGAPIGRIEFERLSQRERSAEVMILIGDENVRGRGFGASAMVTLLRYLFHQRNLHRVWLTVLSWNDAAIRSYQNVGFVIEGTLREDKYFDGTAHDQFVMSMLRPEFDAKWAAMPPGVSS